MRFWDHARATKAEKVGFWAGIGGYFFIFGFGGRCAGSINVFGGSDGQRWEVRLTSDAALASPDRATRRLWLLA